jgi:hypothetical protein
MVAYLSGAAIANKNELESRAGLLRGAGCCGHLAISDVENVCVRDKCE